MDLQSEISQLKIEEKKLRNEIEILQEKIQKLEKSKDLLENENKVLKEMILKENAISASSNLSAIQPFLTDFDNLLENQGKEISTLIENRDTLSKLIFQSLSTISYQEIYLEKFKTAITKLFSLISNPEQNYSSLIIEFEKLGFSSLPLQELFRKLTIHQFIVKPQDSSFSSKKIYSEETNQALKNLVKSPCDSNALNKLTQYITTNIERQTELENQLEFEKAKSNTLYNNIKDIIKAFGFKDTNNFKVKKILNAIKVLKKECKEKHELEIQLNQVIQALISYAKQFDSDLSAKCLIGRIQRWSEIRYNHPDISSEILTLLNVCHQIDLFI